MMSEKLKDAEPYNIFFSSHSDIEETHNHENFITFSDLLCPSLGKLKYSLQVTNSLDIEWLLSEYEKAGYRNIPLVILYGKENPEVDEYLETNHPANVTVKRIESSVLHGKHRSKMGIYVYDDNSLRVVVSSANADNFSWTKYCEMTWISPICKPIEKPTLNASGPTNFKGSLMQYLRKYPRDILNDCMNFIKNVDFSDVKVFLVTSTPGMCYIGKEEIECHSERIAYLLSKHCKLPDEEVSKDPWPIVVQASSIGNVGSSPTTWWKPTFLRSTDSHKDNEKPNNSNAVVKIVYPTRQQVIDSLSEDADANRHMNFFLSDFEWPKKMLCSWKADKYHLSKVMPRCKCYCRISPCSTKLAWFFLTSANLSKGAWGGKICKRGQIYVRTFELGVLFLPKFFGETYFNIKRENESSFPLIFDVPLNPYTSEDEPYCNDWVH